MAVQKYHGDERERARAAEIKWLANPENAAKKKARQRERKREWRSENSDLNKLRMQQDYQRHRMKRRASVRRYLHGVPESEYNWLFIKQDAACAICLHREWVEKGGEVVDLSVDHDHDTGARRGLLCTKCNIALGWFKDSPQLLRRAAEYLEKHGRRF